MAAVVEAVRAEIAPVVSLYVNEWNLSARRAYEKAGFDEAGTLRHDHVLTDLGRRTASTD